MVNKQYSEKQLKVIRGEIPLETVGTKTALALYNKAVANNDVEIAKSAQERIEKAKLETIDRNRKRARESARRCYLKIMPGNYEWKQPKSNVYTEHQKQVIRGEIPIEKVHTNNLIHIHQKALTNYDYELAERVLDIIETRRIEAYDRKYRWRTHVRGNRAKKLSYDFDRNDIKNEGLSKYEYGLLNGYVGLSECSEDELIRLINQLIKQNDKEKLAIAQLLLKYKQDPKFIYITQNHWEAINLIENMLQIPIRRPWTWFKSETK
ncbi:MAG: hypothetical protein IJ360_01440 [Clostridia bacterium]|nr:hypothetical protein [Clostridia bacterium]